MNNLTNVRTKGTYETAFVWPLVARVMVRRRPHNGVAVVVAAADHDELEAGLGDTNDLVRFQCKSRFGQLKFA